VARLSETPVDAGPDTSTEPAALPGDALREGVIERLRADLGEGLVDSHLVPQTDLWVRVTAAAWADAARSLKAQGFDYFCFLSALDWLPSPYGKSEDDPSVPPEDKPVPSNVPVPGYTGGDTRWQVFARVTDLRRHFGVTIKADVTPDPDTGELVVPTWIGSYAGANWHERETHEMFGIGFAGHPDLRNLYLPTEFEGYPLRKDFPLLSRMIKPWPGIVDVEPMPGVAADEEGTPEAAAE
jgi:NADH-quinone oxidoreductase subunit C